MKKLFNRTLFVLCAVILLISVVFAWAAAEEAATPTDLIPQEEEIIPENPGKEPEPEGETGEEGITSVEVVITKTLTVGQSWEGKMKKTKPAVLKLDVTRPGLVYMLVEGKDVWATVEKSDRQTENPTRTKTDPETNQMVISWEAEEGSYLITLGPVEPNLLAKASVSFMDKTAYDAWKAEQAEKETEPEAEPEPEEEPEAEPDEEAEEPKEEPDEEPEEKPETESEEAETEPETEPEELKEEPEEAETDPVTEPEEEQPEEAETDPETEPEEEQPEENESESENGEGKIPDESEDRFVKTNLKWDVVFPIIGDTAHLSAELIGYDELEYTLQWQTSPDKEQWTDVPEATDLTLDVLMTEENNHYYWRLVVYLEDDQEV